MAKEIKKVAIQLSLDVDKQGAVAQVKSVTESMKKKRQTPFLGPYLK